MAAGGPAPDGRGAPLDATARARDTRRVLDRRTKIMATLGPSTDPPGVLDELIASGVDCARLNCSHGTHDDLRRRAAEVRAAAERAGRAIGLLFDLQGPKLRLTGDLTPITVRKGDALTFCGARRPGGEGRALVEFHDFAALVTPRSQLVIGDGVPRFAVEAVADGDVHARALSDGQVLPRKGINVTYARPELPALTEKDIADLQLAAEQGADFVALSFVRSATDIEQLRAMLHASGASPRLVA